MKRLPILRFARLVTAGALAAFLLGGGVRLGAADFIRGDVNGDGAVSLSDVQPIMNYLFRGGQPPECLSAADVEPTDYVDIRDGQALLGFLFGSDAPPPAPFPGVGADDGSSPTLGCESYGNGSPYPDPAAELQILDAEAPGGSAGDARIVVAVSNSAVIAGFSGNILVDTAVIGGAGVRPRALVEPSRSNYLANSLSNGRLKFAYMRNLVEEDFVPPGEGVELLEISFCLKQGAKAGEYPLELVAGELVEAASGRAIAPSLVSGTLKILADLSDGAGCNCKDFPPPPPPVVPPELNTEFKIGDAAAASGSTVSLPFSIRADAEVQAFSFSVDFDEEVLEAQAVEKVFQKPDGTDWDIKVFKFNNSNATPGNGGVDEGFLVGGAVFSKLDACNYLPANRENEVLRFQFLVKPEAPAGSTGIRFLDGGQINSSPYNNILTAFARAWTPETASSFVFVDGRIGVLPEITTFIRGDSNGDEKVDVSDGQHTLGHLFLGGERPYCYDAADANDDGAIDIADAVSTLSFLFLDSGARIPPPYPQAGEDPTPDDLRCLSRS